MADMIAQFTLEGAEHDIEIKRLTNSSDDAEGYAREIQRVLLSSWEKRFVQEVHPSMTTGPKLREMFDPEKSGAVFKQKTRIINAKRERATYLSAEYPVNWQTVVAGIGKVISYSPEGRMKRIAGAGRYPYPYIHDVAVSPTSQRKGIGSALMLAMLRDFGPKKPVSLYAYEGNDPAIDWFTRLGFEEKDRTEELGLLGKGTVVNQIHFEAPSVASVRGAIIDRHPSLAKVA